MTYSPRRIRERKGSANWTRAVRNAQVVAQQWIAGEQAIREDERRVMVGEAIRAISDCASVKDNPDLIFRSDARRGILRHMAREVA